MLVRVAWVLLLLVALPMVSAAASQQNRINLPGGQMILHFEDRFSTAEQAKLKRWLESAGQAILTFYGEFPVARADVHLYASRLANEPVPWGEVLKAPAYQVNFHVNPGFTLEDFLADWTASHELSHLFHPYPGRGHSWFGEGLASYLQNTLRARQGALTEQQAFLKLFQGFERGRKKAQQTAGSIADASISMRRKRSFMQVYWGGAAYFLQVDMRLRKEGEHSLDSAWLAFKKCCLKAGESWSPERMIRKLDSLTGTQIFSQEYQRMILAQPFPDFRKLLLGLGIVEKDGRLTLAQTGAAARLRQQIVTAP